MFACDDDVVNATVGNLEAVGAACRRLLDRSQDVVRQAWDAGDGPDERPLTLAVPSALRQKLNLIEGCAGVEDTLRAQEELHVAFVDDDAADDSRVARPAEEPHPVERRGVERVDERGEVPRKGHDALSLARGRRDSARDLSYTHDMAAKYVTVTPEDLKRLEGQLQKLRDMDAHEIPKELPHDFVAGTLGVKSSTVRQWVRLARPISRRSENAAAFIDVYDQIARALASPVIGAVFTTALNPGGRDSFRAQQWLLPRIDAVTYGDVDESQDEDDGLDIARQPQEVYDQVTAEEWERIEELVTIREQAQKEAEEIFLKAKQRLVSLQIAKHQTH